VTNRRKPPNNGTVVIFHLLPGTTDEAVGEALSKYGTVRQVRSPPDRDTQRFVEFWDLRDAERAVKEMRGRVILNARVSVEYSLPGGCRKDPNALSEYRAPTVVRKTTAPLSMSF
jgi:RNA recognition motif-containing protein